MYIQGKPVGYFILGHPAHPLSDWLIKPYAQGITLTAQQESFNAYVSAAQTVAKNTFGRLRARWRVLRKKNDFRYTFTPYMAAACCALHNFCEWENEPISLEWQEEARLDAELHPQPTRPPHTDSDIKSETVRDALTEYLASNYPFLRLL